MATIVWTGAAGDGNFNNPANWSPQQVPGATDTVTISPSAATAISVANDAVGSLTTNANVTLTVQNNTGFTFGNGAGNASFSNGGTLVLESTGYGTDLVVDAAKLTLNGGGTVMLSDNANNFIVGSAAADTLDNVNNLIEGAGHLGNGTLTFVNGAAGVVNADDVNALFLNTGAKAATNSGLLEATGSGGLVLNSVVNNGGTGRISAEGGDVYLQGGTIAGGTITSSGGAAVIENGGGTLDGTAHAVTNNGSVVVGNNTSLGLLGSLVNNGTLLLASNGNGTDLVIGPSSKAPQTVMLSGTGSLVLSDNANNAIVAGEAGDTLVNGELIAGAGKFSGGLALLNQGTIDADGGNALVLTAGVAVTNNKLLEATAAGGGGLVIETAVTNSAGTILAAGGNVYLADGTIAGGTIATSGGGEFIESGGGTVGGTLDGTAATVTNTGTVVVDQGTALQLLGTITNSGVLLLNSFGYGTNLLIGSTSTAGTVTLTGGGLVTTTDNGNNTILGGVAGDTLVNANNTIAGAGSFGASLTLINDSVINADDGNALVLRTGNTVTNNGTLEATLVGGGGFVIQDVVDNSGGGTILAAGGNVYLNGGTLIGGTIQSSGGGALITNNGTLNGLSQTVTNRGTVVVNNNTTLYAEGTITNQGTLQLASSGYGTALTIESAAVTLTGGGVVSLSDNTNNYIEGASGGNVLDNVNNTIEGTGQLGNGVLTFVNAAKGIVDATGIGPLTINTGANAVQNAGLLESTGAGGLYITSTVVTNTGAGRLAVNGGNIYLSGATIQGGTLTAPGAGMYYDINASTLDGTNSAVTNKSTVVINNNVVLHALGTLNNLGTVSLASSGYGTALIVGPSGTAGTFTLTGGGQIVMSDNANNYIYGAMAGDTLVNLNNTISGAGDIGDSQMVLINDATIDATGGNALRISTGSVVTNNGLLEATGAGGLTINDVIDNTGGGRIGAFGSNVTLSGATIRGGVLNASGGGQYIDASSSTLDGSAQALTNNATVVVNNNTVLYALGTLNNAGTILVNSDGYGTALIVGPSGTAGTFTLTGGGQIVMSNNTNNYLYGATAGDTLVNLNNIISGAGVIGDGQMNLINDAVIDGNDGSQLTISTTSLVNNGLIETTNTGGMAINASISNSGGTIAALGGNISVNGATLSGGLLASAAGFGFSLNSATLDGSAHVLTNMASLSVDNNTASYMDGTIANFGTITVDSTGYGTALLLEGATVTLTGSGTLALTDNANNFIYGAATADVLDNVSNTIEGAGHLGDGQMTLVNSGVIEATGANALVIDLGSTGLNTATGELAGLGAGGLVLQDGTYTNDGLILAGDGSAVTFQSSAVLTNYVNGTLTGGAYAALDAGHGATLNLGGVAMTTDAATIELSGAHAVIDAGGVSITTTLDDISAGGQLLLVNGANFAGGGGGGVFIDNGLLELAGGTFTDGTLTIANGANFVGFGTIAANVVNDGTITITGGQLTFDGTVTGTGTVVMGQGGIIDLIGGGALPDNVSGNGTLELNFGTYTIGSAPPTVSNIQVDSTASLTGTGTLSNIIDDSGTLAAQGGTLTLDGALSGAGALLADAGATLELAGGGSFAGSIGGAGTVLIDSDTMLTQGATISAANIVQTAQVTLGASESLTNNAGSVFTMTSTNVPGERHRAQIEMNGAAGDSLNNAGMLVANGSGLEVIAIAFANSGVVEVTAGELALNKGMTGGGTLAVSAGALLSISGASSFSGLVNGAGTVKFNGATTFNVGAALDAAKIVATNNLTLAAGENPTNLAGDKFTLTATAPLGVRHRAQIEMKGATGDTFANAGTVLANGTGTEAFGVAVTSTGSISATAGTLTFLNTFGGSGQVSASAGAVIDFTGATTFAGTMSGAGTLRFDGDVTLNAGATLTAATVVETGNLTLGTSENIANRAGNTYTFTPGGTDESNPPHRAQITVSGSGSDLFSNAGSIVANGSSSVTVDLAFANTGGVLIGSGSMVFMGSAANNGTIDAAGGSAVFNTAVSGTGTLEVGPTGTLSLLAGAGAGQTVDFLAGTGLVDLSTPLAFGGTIAGFGGGDVIDLIGTPESSFSYANNTLTVLNGTTEVAALKFAGAYQQSDFSLGSDGSGGTLVKFV
jgi:hypothetical protein